MTLTSQLHLDSNVHGQAQFFQATISAKPRAERTGALGSRVGPEPSACNR